MIADFLGACSLFPEQKLTETFNWNLVTVHVAGLTHVPGFLEACREYKEPMADASTPTPRLQYLR